VPDRHGAGTGAFEFESVSGVYAELQCGSYFVIGPVEPSDGDFAAIVLPQEVE
jgi:hypothetical protein